MKNLRFLLLLLLLPALPVWAQQGKLFIIGGGARSPELIQDMVTTAGLGPRDYVVVLPMASAEPEASFASIAGQIRVATPRPVVCLNLALPAASARRRRQQIDSLRRARLIFITGGDQDRFMRVVAGTPIETAIRAAYTGGATVAGTSAGAAVMSRHMITGRELLPDTTYHETFRKLQPGNIEFKPGLGLIDSVIVDQHFVRRSRYNRLISALAAYPGFTCVGIDEGTALVVQGRRARISGVSQVIRLARPEQLRTTDGLLRLKDAELSIYADGDIFEW
ncbi:cyanophycinase [Hymenobacter sp. ISL-91]|uniref:cyanophycinase n=1 Tax=Hymenobacter sp. ISL-91 TaxID=2819151 RepID=UPI001BE8484B|nr:cyanophycinase [Hymenobacter sp. ISL-91]MBT2557093.1 cyanophycinase [Hymenobacter sp. ISL-91]